MMRKMFGVEMDVPSGKLPGFYAQVIHKIGDQATIFDRDGQLMIVATEKDLQELLAILDKHDMAGERFELWLMPAGTTIEVISDFGFISMSGHVFLYTHLIAGFSLDSAVGREQDRWAALQQMKEHIIHSLPEVANKTLHLIDKNDGELINGIARAYSIKLDWELT